MLYTVEQVKAMQYGHPQKLCSMVLKNGDAIEIFNNQHCKTFRDGKFLEETSLDNEEFDKLLEEFDELDKENSSSIESY